jgi:hypothetical protein
MHLRFLNGYSSGVYSLQPLRLLPPSKSESLHFVSPVVRFVPVRLVNDKYFPLGSFNRHCSSAPV